MDQGYAEPPPIHYLLLEGRAVYEYASSRLLMPWLLDGPEGDGHPVVVLPGFIASGFSTRPLRTFLHHKGYNSHCWKQGRNLGLSSQLEGQMLERLESIHDRYGRKVSLVGWSLGGIYSRWLANHRPDLVRGIITLGSPFTDNPKANHSWQLFERLSRRRIDEIDPHTHDMIRRTPPVPTTSIFTRTDGITSWRCCITEEGELSENVQVAGSHCGLGVNPLALHVIADRLAQPEGGWQRFRRSGLRRLLYPRPINQQKGGRHGSGPGNSHRDARNQEPGDRETAPA
ncbi:MAG: alpha/beta hydrolase [Holophagales bacterium]|nr:alpha/beta hydrolase [Holophagales bacterium]